MTSLPFLSGFRSTKSLVPDKTTPLACTNLVSYLFSYHTFSFLHLLPASLNWLHVLYTHWPFHFPIQDYFFFFFLYLQIVRKSPRDHAGCCLFLAFLLIRAIVDCCTLIMQDSPVKFQILPANAFYLISRFPVILEFLEIVCTFATKDGDSQQGMSSAYLFLFSWPFPLARGIP